MALTRLLLAAAAAAGSSAGPVYNESTALLYAQYARVSFCDRGNIESWRCGDICRVASSVPGSARYLGPGSVFDVQGYVAQIPSTDGVRCIAAFRGTSNYNLRNALADALIWRTAWPSGGAAWCPGCAVLSGYAGAYGELRDEMLAAIRSLSCRSLALAGHSLGAGLAALAAVELRAGEGIHVDAVWTFGKPRVGNRAFVEASIRAAGEQGVEPPLWRVVHYHDLIPRVPWHFVGYHHEPLEVYYTDEASTSYRVCPPTAEHLEDPRCMLATPWYRCSMDDHCNYLHGITFEEADFSPECISEQPSPWPMALALSPLLFCLLACCAACCACRRRAGKARTDKSCGTEPLLG